jgi:hypothetical protein
VLVAAARARVWEFGNKSPRKWLFFKFQTVAGFFRFCGCLKVVMEMDYYVMQYRNYEYAKAPTKTFEEQFQ